ncbi:hypothetical protein PFISCL1PPCAC_6924, partial [Pristionchus fissidentatus]
YGEGGVIDNYLFSVGGARQEGSGEDQRSSKSFRVDLPLYSRLRELFNFVLLVRHNPGELIRVDVVHERDAYVHPPLIQLNRSSASETQQNSDD